MIDLVLVDAADESICTAVPLLRRQQHRGLLRHVIADAVWCVRQPLVPPRLPAVEVDENLASIAFVALTHDLG